MAIKGLFICDLEHEFAKSFLEQKGLILSKSKIILSSKKFLGQYTCNSIRNFLSAQLFNLSLSREISSSLFLISKKGLRDRGSLVVKQSEHKGRVVLVWFRTCKGLLQDSGTLKRVAWGLDVGTRVWPNQYKYEFAIFLPLNSFIYYCLLLLFSKFNFHNYLGIHFERNLGFWV